VSWQAGVEIPGKGPAWAWRSNGGEILPANQYASTRHHHSSVPIPDQRPRRRQFRLIAPTTSSMRWGRSFHRARRPPDGRGRRVLEVQQVKSFTHLAAWPIWALASSSPTEDFILVHAGACSVTSSPASKLISIARSLRRHDRERFEAAIVTAWH